MINFKKFLEELHESEDLLQQINDELEEMSAEEIDELGYILFSEFFDYDEEFYEDDEYTLDDVKEMIEELGPDMYEAVYELLDEDDIDDLEDGVYEGVTARMKTSNINRKKRKFMSTSKAELRRTKAKRKKDARQNKSARKRYYKANKQKIAKYQKSRSAAIAKGKHNVKKRRPT